MDKPAGPESPSLCSRVHILHDEPLGKLPHGQPGRRRPRVVRVRWRRLQPDGRHLQQRLKLLGEPWFDDFVAHAQPVLQPGHKYRMSRQVEHGPWPERRDDLALSDLAVRFDRAFALHASSSSCISMPSSVLTHRFTLGSTSRIERLARNFRRLDGSIFNSGLRNS